MEEAEGAIIDWDDAYANAVHIPGGAAYPARWQREAAAFRATARFRDGLFWPEGAARGLAVFIHGGWWVSFSPLSFSHLAAGAVARGWAVLLPGYILAPQARIGAIGRQVAAAIAEAAGRVPGPVVLSGHSAGGQVCARMLCADGLLPPAVQGRVARSVPISGLFDLRPLMGLTANADLRIDPAEAAAESPPLLLPGSRAPMTVWIGADERQPFLWQSAMMAAAWAGLGVPMRHVVEAGRHHFDVIEGLARPDSPLTRALVGDL